MWHRLASSCVRLLARAFSPSDLQDKFQLIFANWNYVSFELLNGSMIVGRVIFWKQLFPCIVICDPAVPVTLLCKHLHVVAIAILTNFCFILWTSSLIVMAISDCKRNCFYTLSSRSMLSMYTTNGEKAIQHIQTLSLYKNVQEKAPRSPALTPQKFQIIIIYIIDVPESHSGVQLMAITLLYASWPC